MYVKSLFLILYIFGNLQLFSMEIMLHKKIDERCWWKSIWFFTKTMQEYGNMPNEIANIIINNSYLLRINKVYKKFNSFFLFDPEIVKFNTSYPDKIKHCRKFYTIEPYDLLFFTKKQDKILSSLVSIPTYFNHVGGHSPCAIKGLIYPVLRDTIFCLTPTEYENYLTLPAEFRQKLNKYPMFWSLDEHINDKTPSNTIQIQ